jgi:hypothetical protein
MVGVLVVGVGETLIIVELGTGKGTKFFAVSSALRDRNGPDCYSYHWDLSAGIPGFSPPRHPTRTLSLSISFCAPYRQCFRILSPKLSLRNPADPDSIFSPSHQLVQYVALEGDIVKKEITLEFVILVMACDKRPLLPRRHAKDPGGLLYSFPARSTR